MIAEGLTALYFPFVRMITAAVETKIERVQESSDLFHRIPTVVVERLDYDDVCYRDLPFSG